MKHKEKEMVLKEICSRIPYEQWVQYEDKNYLVTGYGHGRVSLLPSVFSSIGGPCPLIDEVKLYLRPISSMTKEEWGEFEKKFDVPLGAGGSATYFKVYDYVVIDFGCHYDMMLSDMADMLSWLYLHHFDINNLIGKGLALEAPTDMYVTK